MESRTPAGFPGANHIVEANGKINQLIQSFFPRLNKQVHSATPGSIPCKNAALRDHQAIQFEQAVCKKPEQTLAFWKKFKIHPSIHLNVMLRPNLT